MIAIVPCLKALADENRLRILMLLRERELCVCELIALLGLSQPLVSSHLAVLRRAGLVEVERLGKRMRYSLTPAGRAGGKAGIVKLVARTLAAEPVVARDLARLRECRDLRRAQAACARGVAPRRAGGARR